MNQQFNILVNYFTLFEGGEKNDFENKIRPIAEKMAHPNLTLHTGKGVMNRKDWFASIEAFANGGGKVDLLSVKVEESLMTIVYKVRLHFPDGSVVEFESRASFKDGMLHHVEPFEPAKYNKFLDIGGAADGSPVAAGQ